MLLHVFTEANKQTRLTELTNSDRRIGKFGQAKFKNG